MTPDKLNDDSRFEDHNKHLSSGRMKPNDETLTLGLTVTIAPELRQKVD